MILAMGIVGNVENIGLEQAGIKVDRTHVVANKYGETGVDAGVCGDRRPGRARPGWRTRRMHEGVIVAEKIAGVKGVHPLNTSNVPGCTYCWPQVASVGMTEAKAKETGHEDQGRPLPLHRQRQGDRAGRGGGPVKTVFDAETGELLGAHMVGAEVTELIQGYVIGRTREATEPGACSHDLPAPDLVRNDARSGARCGQEGAAYRARTARVSRVVKSWQMRARRPRCNAQRCISNPRISASIAGASATEVAT